MFEQVLIQSCLHQEKVKQRILFWQGEAQPKEMTHECELHYFDLDYFFEYDPDLFGMNAYQFVLQLSLIHIS